MTRSSQSVLRRYQQHKEWYWKNRGKQTQFSQNKRCKECGKLITNVSTYCKKCKSLRSRAYNWKGSKALYATKHTWLHNHLGSASYCSFDKTHKSTRFMWANIDGKYSRNPKDYIPLCPSCHGKYDLKRIGKCQKVEQYTLEGKLVKTWDLISDAAEHIGVSINSLRGAFYTKDHIKYGYVWKRIYPDYYDTKRRSV